MPSERRSEPFYKRYYISLGMWLTESGGDWFLYGFVHCQYVQPNPQPILFRWPFHFATQAGISFIHPPITPKSSPNFVHFEVSTTYLPAILPSCIRSYTFWSSLRPMLLYGALIRPRLKNSMASAESALFPTYDPLMVIILMTDSKTGARRYAPAGRPIATTVPRGRTYCKD